MTLQLRYIGIPYKGSEIPGLCICGTTIEEANNFVTQVQNYFEQPGPRQSLMVGFETYPDGKCNFLMDFGQSVGRALIRYVDIDIVRKMEFGLSKFSHYSILAGYGTEDFQLVSPFTFNMFRGELVVDERVIYGKAAIDADWAEVSAMLKAN